jgi:hypothetical protein
MRSVARAIAPFGGAVILTLAVGCGAGAGTLAHNMPADPPTSSNPPPAPPDTVPQESGGNGGTGATGTGGGGAGG